MRLLLLPFLALALTLATADGRAQDGPPDARLVPPAPLNERVLNLPGDPTRPVTLEVTLYTPPGPGPFPLAVMNHGATNASGHNRGERYRYTFSAYYFLSRGYAVALPMARGFALSGGALVHAGCDLVTVGELNGRDIRGVLAALGQFPQIDRSRVVLAGQSFGGWTALAMATQGVPGVRGAVLFSPALRASDCAHQDAAMVQGAGHFGGASSQPTLWFYGDNDSVMPEATWQAVYRAYAVGRRDAELVDVGTVGTDSHQLLSSAANLPLWTSRVDAFLARIGLPAAAVHPEYLPPPPPPPTHFAALDDIGAVPFLAPNGREAYRAFLNRPLPRAFAIAPNGGFSATDLGFDPAARVLQACRQAGLACRLYAVDRNVVWQDTPLVRGYTRIVPTGATAVLNFAFSIDRDCRSRGLTAIRVTMPPEHGTAAVVTRDGHPTLPAGHPLAACGAATVPGRSVTYTPRPGFTGTDALAFEETNVDGGHDDYRLVLIVR